MVGGGEGGGGSGGVAVDHCHCLYLALVTWIRDHRITLPLQDTSVLE